MYQITLGRGKKPKIFLFPQIINKRDNKELKKNTDMVFSWPNNSQAHFFLIKCSTVSDMQIFTKIEKDCLRSGT